MRKVRIHIYLMQNKYNIIIVRFIHINVKVRLFAIIASTKKIENKHKISETYYNICLC